MTTPNLSTADGRLRAAVEWLELPPAPLAYDEEDPQGGFLVTDELFAWFKETGLSSHLRWILNGDLTGGTVEEQRARLLQERRFAEVVKHYDETEQAPLLDAMKAANTGVPMEEAMEGWKTAVLAHRANTALERGNKRWNKAAGN